MSQRNVRSVSRLKIGVDHWLIHRAARCAPKDLSERLEEEWLADLAARPTVVSRLRFAVGCCWATGVIALQYQPSSVPAAASAMDGKLIGAYGSHAAGRLSGRTSTLLLVVSLHAGLFYLLLTTLSHTHAQIVPEPLQNRRLDELHSRSPPPPPPQPQFARIKIEAPTPEVLVPGDPDPSRDVSTDVVQEVSPPPSRPSSPHVVQQVQGGPGIGFPNPDDFYPMLARHMEEQGIATVKVCVDVHGRLTSDPATLQGSGSSRLDEGALKLARAGSGHYRATTEDVQPVNSCYPLRIRFQLKN